MSLGAFFIFLAGLGFWGFVRCTQPLLELHRRLFWVGSIGLVGLPAMIGSLQSTGLIQEVIWPLAAGLMAAEIGWKRAARKWPKLDPVLVRAEQAARNKKRRRKRPPSP